MLAYVRKVFAESRPYDFLTWNSKKTDFAYVRKILAESRLYDFLTWNSKKALMQYLGSTLG